MRRSFVAAIGTALTIILSVTPVSALTAQTLAATPVLTVGGAQSNPDDELVRVTAARKLPDGRIVVALAKPIELRVYARSGKLINRIGRKGGGPGEFRSAVTIPYADNDSIVTLTRSVNRFEVFTPSGKLLHEHEEKESPTPPPLLHRAVLNAPASFATGCARAVMMSLPLATPVNLYEVIPDRSGHFWAHLLQDRAWRIYSQAGPFLGTVTLPAGATVLDLGADYILAHQRDADDIEEVVQYRVNLPAAAPKPSCAAKRDSFPLVATDDARTAELRKVFRDAMTANEMVYSDVAHYPKTADSLKLKLPGGVVYQVIEASQTGYANVALDTRSTLACLIRVGDGTFPWPDGRIFCGN